MLAFRRPRTESPLRRGPADPRRAAVRFVLVTLETEESRRHVREHRDEHNARLAEWMTRQAEAGKLIAGEAFETEHTGPVTIRRDGDGTVTVTESPFTDGSETLGGYVIVDVADRAEAVDLAKTWPTGETVEVRPIWTPS
jgi:hypothetical protein